jgi:hypothetical protein
MAACCHALGTERMIGSGTPGAKRVGDAASGGAASDEPLTGAPVRGRAP